MKDKSDSVLLQNKLTAESSYKRERNLYINIDSHDYDSNKSLSDKSFKNIAANYDNPIAWNQWQTTVKPRYSEPLDYKPEEYHSNYLPKEVWKFHL